MCTWESPKSNKWEVDPVMSVVGTGSSVGSELVIDLAERLRVNGLPVSTSEVLDGIGALSAVDLNSRALVRAALRTTLVKDHVHEPLFRRSFDQVFPRRPREVGGEAAQPVTVADDDIRDSVVQALRDGEEAALDDALHEAVRHFSGSREGMSSGQEAQRILRRMDVADLYRRYLAAGQGEDGSPCGPVHGATEARQAIEQLKSQLADVIASRRSTGDEVQDSLGRDLEDRSLLRARGDELAAMRAIVRPLARRLAAKLGSRRRQGGSGVDMRRTIRASMGSGGVPVTPVLRRRRPTKPDLVVLCDVSGSTAQFAPFILTVLHAVHEEFHRVRSFVFIDGIVEISDLLEAKRGVLDPHYLLSRRGLIAGDGRSDYARALNSFMGDQDDVIRSNSTVLIVGDARSHDRASAAPALAQIRHRSRRLYWLNPEPRDQWDLQDSRASEYAAHCTNCFEVSTIRQLAAAVTTIV